MRVEYAEPRPSRDAIHCRARVHTCGMDGGLHPFIRKSPIFMVAFALTRYTDTQSTVSSSLSTRSGAWTSSVWETPVWSLAKVAARRLQVVKCATVFRHHGADMPVLSELQIASQLHPCLEMGIPGLWEVNSSLTKLVYED
jgi:hypothetical protein